MMDEMYRVLEEEISVNIHLALVLEKAQDQDTVCGLFWKRKVNFCECSGKQALKGFFQYKII